MTIVLDGSSLSIEKLVNIARNNEKVQLAPEALSRIKTCRAMLEDKIAAREIMYGVNTGIGEFSEIVLDDDQVKAFQKYLYRRSRADRICPRGNGRKNKRACTRPLWLSSGNHINFDRDAKQGRNPGCLPEGFCGSIR